MIGAAARLRPLLLLLFTFVGAEKVMLLDTQTTSGELGWRTHSVYGGPEEGWLEETFLSGDSNTNYRAYVVCEVESEKVDNWLRTPFIPRGPANRLFVNVTFSMRDCSLFRNKARNCGETFNLLYHETKEALLEERLPRWKVVDLATQDGYKKIDRITGDAGRFSEHDKADVDESSVKNVEIRGVAVSKGGVYFAFQDEGACTSILSVSVYYEVCPDVTAGLAWFAETATAGESSELVDRIGECVDHAEPSAAGPPKYLCKADGTWAILQNPCACLEGYEPLGDLCRACPAGEYSVGGQDPMVGRCLRCPANSESREIGSGECACREGFWRAPNEGPQSPCSQPPSKPLDLKVGETSQTSALLTWVEPVKLGGRKDLVYRIEAKPAVLGLDTRPKALRRTAQGAVFLPGNLSSVEITGLSPGQEYMVFLYAENGVSEQDSKKPYYAVAEVSLPSAAGMSAEMGPPSLYKASDSSLTIRWHPPKDSKVREYHLAYSLEGGDGEEQQMLGIGASTTSLALRQLQPSSRYRIRVRAQTPLGLGDWSPALMAETAVLGEERRRNSTPEGGEEGETDSTGYVVLAIVGGVLCLCFLLLCLVCVARRRSGGGKRSKQPSDLDVLDYRGGGQLTPDYTGGLHYGPYDSRHPTLGRKLTAPLVPNIGKEFKPYIDPLAYEDPNEALKEHTHELDPNSLYIEAKMLGGGESGQVHQGKLRLPGRPEEKVAVKSLRPGASPSARQEFLQEAAIMGQFQHPNVIRLLGVLTRTEPVMIVTEFMEHKSLDHFLRINDCRLGIAEQLGLLRGIAVGMAYLAAKGYVHRDLAARNVLVGRQMECKISDFGLSRGMNGGGYDGDEHFYHTRGGKIPVRWTAPEAIAYRKYTSASDVWSFGIVIWEVASYGERPYWDWSNEDVIQSVGKGYRLPAPMGCPPGLHNLMLECWREDRSERPNFAVLERRLAEFARSPDLVYAPASTGTSTLSSELYDHTNRASPSPGGPPPPAPHQPPPLPSLHELLEGLGLGRFSQAFLDHGVSSLPALSRLGIVDLMTYGIGQADCVRIQQALSPFAASTLPRPPPRPPHPAIASVATLHAPGRPYAEAPAQGYFI